MRVEIEYVDNSPTEAFEAEWAHIRDMCLTFRRKDAPPGVAEGVPLLRVARWRMIETKVTGRATIGATAVHAVGVTPVTV
jgi:hypothetical protein